MTAIGTANKTPINPNNEAPINIQMKITSALIPRVLFIIIGVRILFSDWLTSIYRPKTKSDIFHPAANMVTKKAIAIPINAQTYGMKFMRPAIIARVPIFGICTHRIQAAN